MSVYFDPVTNGFYLKKIDGSIEISNDERNALLMEQSKGRPISSDENGNPINIDPPKPGNADIENIRLKAYSDPITGSDRYFSEASRMEAAGEPGFDEVRKAGLARYKEIQEAYPWNEE